MIFWQMTNIYIIIAVGEQIGHRAGRFHAATINSNEGNQPRQYEISRFAAKMNSDYHRTSASGKPRLATGSNSALFSMHFSAVLLALKPDLRRDGNLSHQLIRVHPVR